MSEQYAWRRVNVRAIIYKDGKVLAVKHKSKDGSVSEYYAVPGGGLDPHESLVDGIKREIIEETGVEPAVGRLLFIQQFASKREGYTEDLELFFEITNADDYECVDLASTTHGKDEIAICEFVDPTAVRILPKFMSTISLATFIETNQPLLVVDSFGETI